MNWSRSVRCVCWLDELLADLGYVFNVPLLHIRREWRQCRAARRETDRRLAAWRALSPEEQLRYIHPASPEKAPEWTIERYRAAQRRRDGAH